MLMHFGMTGNIKIKGLKSHMIFLEGGGDKKLKEEMENGTKDESEPEWPPRFTKFDMVLGGLELAFTDPRRLARVRVFTGEQYATDENLLTMSPLSELGPDYLKSPDAKPITDFTFGDPDPDHHGRPRLDFELFSQLLLKKKKPIKSFLLDQAFFAGVGNWVSDEILYHAKIYPAENISEKIDDPNDPVIKALYDAIIYVMEECVRVEGNARSFPETWLMIHRWGKGRKGPKAKVGEHPVDHVTVGGRTSCFVPFVQKPLKRSATAEPKAKRVKGEAKKIKAEAKKVKVEGKKVQVEASIKTELDDEGATATVTKSATRRSKRLRQ